MQEWPILREALCANPVRAPEGRGSKTQQRSSEKVGEKDKQEEEEKSSDKQREKEREIRYWMKGFQLNPS